MIPIHLRPVALILGALLSGVVIVSDSRLAVDASLMLLALALLAFQMPALAAPFEDDSE